LVLRPHSAVGLTPRLAEWIPRDSRRNPVLEICHPPTIASENRSSALVLVVKSPPRIDITPRHRDTRIHDDENHFLHA